MLDDAHLTEPWSSSCATTRRRPPPLSRDSSGTHRGTRRTTSARRSRRQPKPRAPTPGRCARRASSAPSSRSAASKNTAKSRRRTRRREFEALRYRLYTLEAAIGRTVDAADRVWRDVRLCVLIDGASSDSRVRIAHPRTDRRRRRRHSTPRQDNCLCRDCSSLARSHRSCSRHSAASIGPTRSLIINDRPDIAAAVDADGVHLGQDDFTVKDARAVLGPRKLIGVSTHSIEQARAGRARWRQLHRRRPDVSLADESVRRLPGLELLRQVAAEIRLPAFAIGGITPANVGDVLATGIARVAVSSARQPARLIAQRVAVRRIAATALAASTAWNPHPARRV